MAGDYKKEKHPTYVSHFKVISAVLLLDNNSQDQENDNKIDWSDYFLLSGGNE